jgi:hypothetical protein
MNMKAPRAALLGLLACLLAGPLGTASLAQDSVGVERLTGTLKIGQPETVTIGFATPRCRFPISTRAAIGYTIDLCLASSTRSRRSSAWPTSTSNIFR